MQALARKAEQEAKKRSADLCLVAMHNSRAGMLAALCVCVCVCVCVSVCARQSNLSVTLAFDFCSGTQHGEGQLGG